MKRRLVVSLILVLLISALAGILFIGNVTANFAPQNAPPSPVIEVNLDTLNPFLLIVSMYEREWIPIGIWGIWEASISPIQVWIDGSLWAEHDWVADSSVSVSLEGLGDGWHTVEASATASGECCVDGKYVWLESEGSSGLLQFLVDTSAPRIWNVKVQHKSVGGDVQLSLRVTDYSLSWLGYSLDGEENVAVSWDAFVQSAFGPLTSWSGNLNLTGLSGGEHSVVVFARDDAGNEGCSESFSFVVTHQEDSQDSEPFPTTLVGIVIIASVALVSFGLVAYFVRRNRKRSK